VMWCTFGEVHHITPDYLSNFDHPLNSLSSTQTDIFGNIYDILILLQGQQGIFQGDLIHMRTTHPAQSQHIFLRVGRGNIVAHGALCQQQILWRISFFHVSDHRCRAGRIIGGSHNFRAAFRVCQDNHFRVLLPDIFNILNSELLVNFTTTMPTDHLIIQIWVRTRFQLRWENNMFASFPGDITRQIFIWQKDNRL